MSEIEDLIADGLADLSEAKSESLSYSATQAGSYTAITGFVLVMNATENVREFDDRSMEQQIETATLVGPLAPAIARGNFVKDSHNSDRIWYVESVTTDQQQIAKCRRVHQIATTINRGARL